MRQSHSPEPAPQRRRPAHRASATTAAGIAAERIALADRERARALRAGSGKTAAR